MLLQNINQVVGVLFVHVLDAKVIHDKREANWARLVFPKARGVLALVISMFVELLLQQFLRNGARVRQPVHPFHSLEKKPSESTLSLSL